MLITTAHILEEGKMENVFSSSKSAVGISHRIDVEHALGELKTPGLPAAEIYIVAKYPECDTELEKVGNSNCARDEDREDVATGIVGGGILGAVVGCLAGLGMVAIPGVGLIVAAGTISTTLATTVAGAGIGIVSGGLISALAYLQITSDQAKVVSDSCWQEQFLVIVHGTDDQVHRAESCLIQLRSSQVWVC